MRFFYVIPSLRKPQTACVEIHFRFSYATYIGVSLSEGEAESCNKICFDPLSGFCTLGRASLLIHYAWILHECSHISTGKGESWLRKLLGNWAVTLFLSVSQSLHLCRSTHTHALTHKLIRDCLSRYTRKFCYTS
jgi:hypothetical protein